MNSQQTGAIASYIDKVLQQIRVNEGFGHVTACLTSIDHHGGKYVVIHVRYKHGCYKVQ